MTTEDKVLLYLAQRPRRYFTPEYLRRRVHERAHDVLPELVAQGVVREIVVRDQRIYGIS